jgi:hypothetical protein
MLKERLPEFLMGGCETAHIYFDKFKGKLTALMVGNHCEFPYFFFSDYSCSAAYLLAF